jgi:hypothetical protein
VEGGSIGKPPHLPFCRERSLESWDYGLRICQELSWDPTKASELHTHCQGSKPLLSDLYKPSRYRGQQREVDSVLSHGPQDQARHSTTASSHCTGHPLVGHAKLA